MIDEIRNQKFTKTFYWKAPFDRGIAVVLLVPGIPMLLFLGVLVRLTSKGPALFRQTRVGKQGKLFTMYKIRSMRLDAEKHGAIWATKNDPRTTWLGHYLRKFHLDEIPQLLNVLRGEMSLVGPRPERPEFVEQLKEKIPGYANRLQTLPGITGLAQLNLPPDSDLDSVRRKQILDLEYIHEATPWLDCRIFFCTFGRLVKFPESVLLKLLGLHRTVDDRAIRPFRVTRRDISHEPIHSEKIVAERISSIRTEETISQKL